MPVPVGCKSNSIFQAKSFSRLLIPVQDTKESDSLTSSEHFCEIKVVSVICLKKEEVEGQEKLVVSLRKKEHARTIFVSRSYLSRDQASLEEVEVTAFFYLSIHRHYTDIDMYWYLSVP